MIGIKKYIVLISLLGYQLSLYSQQPYDSTGTKRILGERTITTSDGVKLSVKIAGKGPVLLYIHGGPGQDYLSFEKMGGSNLEKCATLVYLDQRGSGHSQNAENYSLNRVVQDLEEVRQNLGLDKMYLLSHSFGGILAVNYAKKYPQLVKGLILANATLHFLNNSSLRDQIKYEYSLLQKDTVITENRKSALLELSQIVRDRLSHKGLGYKLLADSLMTIDKMESVESSYKRSMGYGNAIIGPFLDSTKPNRHPEYLKDYSLNTPQLNLPVLIITGTHDFAVGPRHYGTFKFPQQKIVKINGSHMLYYERNPEFIKAVCDFLSK